MRGEFSSIWKIFPVLTLVFILALAPAFSEDPLLSPIDGGAPSGDSGFPGGTPESCTTTGLCLDFTSGGDYGFFGVLQNFWDEGIAPLFGQITQSAREWDNLPAKPPENFGPRVVESYGISENELEKACGSNYDRPLIDVSKELSYVFLGIGIVLMILGRFAFKKASWVKVVAAIFFVIFTLSTNIAAWILFGWILFLIILFETLAAPPEDLQEEFLEPDNWKATIAKEVIQSTIGDTEYSRILDVAATADSDYDKLSFVQKATHLADQFLDKSTGIPGVDDRLMGGVSGGAGDGSNKSEDASERLRTKKGALAGREAIKSTIYDVFRAFSVIELGYVWIFLLVVAFATSMNIFGISSYYEYLPVREPTNCVNIWASIIPATFWAFWMWQIVAFTVEKSVFLLAVFLPRPVVIWILLPFNGGPIPVLNSLIQLAFQFLGTLYIVSLAKPLGGSEAYFIKQVVDPATNATTTGLGSTPFPANPMNLFWMAVVAALFYLLLIITSIGIRVLFLYITLPVTVLPKFILGMIKSTSAYGKISQKVSKGKEKFEEVTDKIGGSVDSAKASWTTRMKSVNPWEGKKMTPNQQQKWGAMNKKLDTQVDPSQTKSSIGGFFRSLGSKFGGNK